MLDSSNLQVLLVEDSRHLSERLWELIGQTRGVQPMAVVDSESGAIAAIESAAPDVVILDLHLREGSGFGVMRHLVKQPARPVVIVLTNYALSQYRRQAEALGARYFLDKAQEFDRLPGILAELRDAHHA